MHLYYMDWGAEESSESESITATPSAMRVTRLFTCNQVSSDLGEVFRKLCQDKGIEII